VISFPSATGPGGKKLGGLLCFVAAYDVPWDIRPHAFSLDGAITSGLDTDGQLCRKWLVPIGCVLQMSQRRTAPCGEDMAIGFRQAF